MSREIERLDALASWIESVRDVLMAGEQPIGAITSTVAACPPVIRPQVRRLALGLARQDPDHVFRRFADELDDPLADLVATGLSIAVRRGARTVPVLTALAEQTRQQVDRRRLVEAERAPTRREVRALTAIMGGLVLGLLLLGRSEYLTAYDTATGQVFLAAALDRLRGIDPPRPASRRISASRSLPHQRHRAVRRGAGDRPMRTAGLLTLLSLLCVGGLCLAVTGWIQPAPSLTRTLRHLRRPGSPATPSDDRPDRNGPAVRWAASGLRRHPRLLPTDTQLRLVGRSPEQHVARLVCGGRRRRCSRPAWSWPRCSGRGSSA